MGLGPIFKRQHRPALAAATDAWCGLSRENSNDNVATAEHKAQKVSGANQ